MKSGFTLIELSIVLVIIGLIIGGILTGQDLINAATIRAQIAQIEKYNTAVHTFQGKYGGLPGDLQLTLASQFGFNVTGCNANIGKRDGNGIMDGYYSGNNQWMLFYGEDTLFWSDLGQAGLIDGTYPNSGGTFGGNSICGNPSSNLTLAPGTAYIGDFIPPAKIGNGNFIYVYDSNTADNGVDNNNWWGISAVTSTNVNGDLVSSPAISVSQAYRIDSKIDDGIPNTGAVRDLYINNYGIFQANVTGNDTPGSCYGNIKNTYSIEINGGNGLNCALSLRLQ